ncbi:MAG: hypothetical protein U0230_11280 [Polyangiales bacterium]
MAELRCPRCHDPKLVPLTDPSGAKALFCPRCRAVFCPGSEVARLLGGELAAPSAISLPNPFAKALPALPLACPTADGGDLVETRSGDVDEGLARCERCGSLFLDVGVLGRLRPAAAPPIVRPSLEPATRAPLRIEKPAIDLDAGLDLPSLPPARRSLPTEDDEIVRGSMALDLPADPVAPAPAPVGTVHEAPLRAPTARPLPPPLAPALAPAPRVEEPLASARLEFGHPLVQLLALPISLLLMGLVGATRFGRLLLFPFQIQFHELGHALPAWLSSRAALPLPCGFTSWKEDPSLFTGLCFLFLVGVLVYRGYVEARPFAIAVGITLAVLQGLFSLVLPDDTAKMIILLDGIGGEFWLTTFVMVAFYFPVPDRFRWDFFRFLLLVPAAGAWTASVRLWIDVARGRTPMPMGSLFGAAGDGSGDLERLVNDYDFTQAALTKLYVALAALTGVVLASVYAYFALRAILELQNRREHEA